MAKNRLSHIIQGKRGLVKSLYQTCPCKASFSQDSLEMSLNKMSPPFGWDGTTQAPLWSSSAAFHCCSEESSIDLPENVQMLRQGTVVRRSASAGFAIAARHQVDG